jgi:hypothetical protein
MLVQFENLNEAEEHVSKENGAHDIIGFENKFKVIFETDDNPSRGHIIDEIFKVLEDSELFDDYDEIMFTLRFRGSEVDTTNLEIVTQEYSVIIDDLPN